MMRRRANTKFGTESGGRQGAFEVQFIRCRENMVKFRATVKVKPLREWLEGNLDPVEGRIVLPENGPRMTTQQMFKAMCEIWSEQPELGNVIIDRHGHPLEAVRAVREVW